MKNPHIAAAIPAAFVLYFAAVCAFAQSDTGAITGYVKDQSGAVMAATKVSITNEGTREEHAVMSDEQGFYSVPSLPPGFYTMQVEAAGFKSFSSIHNKLDSNTTISLNANLAIGAANESVQVTATASLLQTESGAVQNVLSEQEIQSSELNGRDPIYQAQLLPGVRGGATFGDFNFSLSNGGYAINGARSNDTLITMDGAPAVRTRARRAHARQRNQHWRSQCRFHGRNPGADGGL